jgi:hypothetical protein
MIQTGLISSSVSLVRSRLLDLGEAAVERVVGGALGHGATARDLLVLTNRLDQVGELAGGAWRGYLAPGRSAQGGLEPPRHHAEPRICLRR